MVMRTGSLVLVLLVVWLLVGLIPVECRADIAAPEEIRQAQQQREEKKRAEKERLTRVGVVLFWLVVALGVLMMAAVIVWGLRTRRITGEKLPDVTADNPLWYLQPGEERATLPPPIQESNSPPPTETHDRAN